MQHTIDDGIYYWWATLEDTLPEGPLPTLHLDNYNILTTPPQDGHVLHAYVDMDWASDMSHWKSVTGIAIMCAGGIIGYKTRYQDTVSQSFTESKFIAAADAGHTILYF